MIRFSVKLGEYYIKPSNIKSLNANMKTRSETNKPSFGIISNTAELELYNVTQDVLTILESADNIKDVKVQIFLENTLGYKNSHIKSLLDEYCVYEYEYDRVNKELNISLSDELVSMQDITVSQQSFIDRPNIQARDAVAILISMSVSHGYKFLVDIRNDSEWESLKDTDIDTYNILQNTQINYFIIRNGSLWSAWQDICGLLGLTVYSRKGYIVIERGL